MSTAQTTLPKTTLTKRERQVIAQASLGKKNHEIADYLGISLETVKSHVKSSLRKLGAKDRAHAVAKCLRHGIIE